MLRIDIDISGQIQQKNLDSSLGAKRSDGVQNAVFLSHQTKKELLGKYKGQINNLVEKMHCLMIYYCIKDLLDGVTEIRVCNDVNFRVVKKLLPLLFKGRLKGVEINNRKRSEPASAGHWPALKAHRKRKYATCIIKRKDVEEKILEFR